MDTDFILDFSARRSLREWLAEHHDTCREAWVVCNRSARAEQRGLPYLDVVYEALCFGWIDSTCKKVGDRMLQRISPRRKGSRWTELNKERCRYLLREGLMTEAGRRVLPDLSDDGFAIDVPILEALRSDPAVAERFSRLPELYRRVRIGNIQMKRSDPEVYRRRMEKFIDCTRRGILYGEWNDGGRLSSCPEYDNGKFNAENRI